MGWFSSNTPDKDTPQKYFPWTELTKISDIDKVYEASQSQPVVIFKHSTRCGISRMALKQFESGFRPGEVGMYYLDLLEHRDISQAIAEKTGVWHESPQLILLHKGEAVYDRSHSAIDASDLQDEIGKRS